MKILNTNIEFPKNQKIFFPLTEKILNHFQGDLWEVVRKMDDLNRGIPVPGFHYICIIGEPYKIRVEFDPEKSTPDQIKAWLIEEGVPVD